MIRVDQVIQKLDKIIELLNKMNRNMNVLEVIMSVELDQLEAQVTKNTDVEQSAIVLINGIAAQVTKLAADLASAGVDNAKALALAVQLKNSADALAAAVVANTPQA